VDHPRLAALYTMSSRCFLIGRVEEAVRYSDAGLAAIESGRYHLPFGSVQWLGGAYLAAGQPQWMVDLCREELRRNPDTHAAIRASLVVALAMTGSVDAAIATGTGLIDAAEAAGNPCTFSYALFAYGYASLGVQPAQARNALRRGLAIARDSGNRSNEAHLAVALLRLEAEYGDALAALDYALLSIRSYHDSGNMNRICVPLAILATFLDRRGRFEPAATIAGFALNTLTASSFTAITVAIAHVREVLGDQTYESLARTGAAMSLAAMATYAYEQIDQLRAEVEELELLTRQDPG
jgi:tetratricopeptide (TPR) repeat protein